MAENNNTPKTPNVQNNQGGQRNNNNRRRRNNGRNYNGERKPQMNKGGSDSQQKNQNKDQNRDQNKEQNRDQNQKQNREFNNKQNRRNNNRERRYDRPRTQFQPKYEKAEETLEDIRHENDRIEKEIWIEIAEIHTIKLD